MRKNVRWQALAGGAAALTLVAAPGSSAQTAGGIETVVVTAQKRSENIQKVPIAISAFSQKELKLEQVAGGPDLIREVPNLTFSKTNFTGYNIQVRGIGTQAISVTTDPAVAIAFNNIPFIRNHFFEQEFFDVDRVEVLRGPQGTLYGRNAPAGVVNIISAEPTDEYEGFASVDVGNYNERRLEGMANIPLDGDRLALRLAGEWTQRDGYAYNEETRHNIDGRNLWSGRATLQFKPLEGLKADLVWEHFWENDNRARSTKQLCQKDPGPSVVDGPAGPQIPDAENFGTAWLTQGCLPGSLYGADAFQTPNGAGIPFVAALELLTPYVKPGTDPYAGLTQSNDLRVVDSLLDPKYKAKNDTLELNVDYDFGGALTLSSQTGYNKDYLYSTEDYNRFNTAPIFRDAGKRTLVGRDGQYCDPQLGCSGTIVGQDVSQEKSEQFYQELRLISSYEGPLNFVAGGNYLHYSTSEDYYVFFNALSLFTEYVNSINGGAKNPKDADHIPFDALLANSCNPIPADPDNLENTLLGLGCAYVDPNALANVDGQGHNYFLSKNPARIDSWALFGEVYYQVAPELKLTGGLRFTDDEKVFTEYPSWAGLAFKGIPSAGQLTQRWQELTGRAVATWTPQFDFTGETLIYGSYSRGYKAGGANPPGVVPIFSGGVQYSSPTAHPLTFKPEFVNAFELGTKNTVLDDSMTLNGAVFYYDYQNYQISQIVDRTSVNLNFNATVKGAELESTWQPSEGLVFNLAAGYQDGTLDSGSQAIDLMDRTAGHSDWMVVRPFITATSNCILPTYVVNELLAHDGLTVACTQAYSQNLDPVTGKPYVPNPDPKHLPGYIGFDPATAPNGGEGFAKNLGGNQLPNTPHLTLSAGAQYTVPVNGNWTATLRGDVYYQTGSFARVFNDRPYDELHGYANVNLSVSFIDGNGLDLMAYVKNLFDATAITGAFLNSDDTALTTNVFLTDPRLFGVRVSKSF
ncbi:MAG TPA: TonB-dependent receptor [Rhizomicrobium sp.]|nr:TonB-dependent receptor [Rhizomicrobium sp.]